MDSILSITELAISLEPTATWELLKDVLIHHQLYTIVGGDHYFYYKFITRYKLYLLTTLLSYHLVKDKIFLAFSSKP